MSVSDLSKESILLITSYLTRFDLDNAVLVSKDFNKVFGNQSLIYGERFLKEFGTDFWGEFVGVHPYLVRLISVIT